MQEQRKAERTRQFIIENTAVVFNKKGYEGTSLSDLTTATGLTKGSIYGNFRNKEEVAAAAFEYNWGIVSKRLEQRLADFITAKEKLLAYATAYRTISKEAMLRGGCPLLNLAVDADDTNPLLKEKAVKAFLKWKSHMARLITTAVAEGDFRADVDAQQAAVSVIALIEGGLMMANLTGKSGYMDDVLDTVEKYIADMSI